MVSASVLAVVVVFRLHYSWTSWARQRWWSGLTTRTLWSCLEFALVVNRFMLSWSSCFMVCWLCVCVAGSLTVCFLFWEAFTYIVVI